MIMKSTVIIGIAALTVAAAAHADVYNFNYKGGLGFEGSGKITTMGTTKMITDISGEFGGMTISGLEPIGSCCSTPANDNLFYADDNAPGGPSYVDIQGLAFGLDGSPLLYNLFYNGKYAIDDSAFRSLSQNGTLSVSLSGSVPEPATWALMLVGVGAAGVALRRSRRQATA